MVASVSFSASSLRATAGDAGALRGESLRDGATQSAAGTGDKRDLAFEIL